MSTPDHLERQAEAAMHRINQQINRSAGQHIRAVRRKLRAGQPPAPNVIDTHQLPGARTAEHHSDASTAEAVCPPGFCGFDARCTDTTCPAHPSQAYQRFAQATHDPDSDSHIGGMEMLVYGLVALALTACAAVVAFAIGLRV